MNKNEERRSKMNSKRTIMITAAVAAAALALAVFVPHLVAAQRSRGYGHGPHGPHGDGGFGAGYMLGHLVGELDLTEDQQAAFHELMATHHEERQGDMEALQTARLALMEQVMADELDEAAIRIASADVAAIEADLNVARAEFMQQVFGILTPEQQEKAKELFAEHKEILEQRRAESGSPGEYGQKRHGQRRQRAPYAPSDGQD
jgi:Spy/CpxP family protein refolding chaperone